MTRRLRKSNFESPICKRFYDKILFPKSASLRENVQFLKYEVFDRFWSKNNNFSTFKKIYKARFWKKNWEAVAKSVEENWRLLVLMSVNNFTVQFTFWKLRALTKSIILPTICCRICLKICMPVRKAFLEQWVLKKVGLHENQFIRNTQKKSPSFFQYKVHQQFHRH